MAPTSKLFRDPSRTLRVQNSMKRLFSVTVLAAIVLLGAGCTDDFVSQVQGTTEVMKTKAAEISAAIDGAKKTMEKAQAIYNILATPSVPPSEDQQQPVTEENTSSPSQPPVPDASIDQSL